MSRDLRASLRAFLVIMAYPVLVKLTITALSTASPGFRSPSQMAVFAWPALAIFLATGSIGTLLTHAIRLPGTWSGAVPLRERLWLPTLAGLAMGVASIGIDRITGWTAISAAAMGIPSIHIAWPQSLLIYPGGAVIVNIIYYLVPIPLLVWLVTRWIRSPAQFNAVFWTVGALAALVEPVTQGMGNGLSTSPGTVLVFGVQDYVANILQVWAFKRAGFGASVVFRVAFYLVWHVLYGFLGG